MWSAAARMLRRWLCLVVVASCWVGAGLGHAQTTSGTATPRVGPALTVDGRIALTALMALSDGHLQKLADTLQLLATSEAARSGDWEQIKGPLGEVGKRNVPALNWFALPDGSYWSVQEGRATGNLDTRTYFPRVLAGHTVLGELVVSKATGKSVAIVAVPVVRPDHAVVGVLGSSVYLDQLSARLKEELGLADPLIFYSFDTAPLLALVYDADLIFADPSKLGEDVGRAFAEMRSHEQGVVTYTFLGTRRTVLYRKSPVTGWWYAFGIAQRD